MTSGKTTQRARLRLASSSTVLALSCTLMNVGCSSNNSNNATDVGGTSSTGGAATNGTGGKATTGTGGKLGTGGTGTSVATGGAAANTGGASSATGGVKATGGATSAATGGSTSAATGGSTSAATGGSTSAATGGSTTNGGTGTTGGSSSVAGNTGTGGATGTGGTSTAGGASGTGGATGTGGSAAGTGGASTAGGQSSTGGTTSNGGGPGTTLRNIEIDMTNMPASHIGKLMEFRIVSASNQLAFRGILDTLPAAAYNYIMPKSIPNGAYHLDFFVDTSGNGVYDPPVGTTYADHQWQLPIPTPGDQVLAFAHNTNFTDISTPATTPIGGDFMFQGTGFPHVGKLFELRVIIASTGQVVGRYVLGAIPASMNINLTIAGVIASGTQYNIDFYADANGNGQYDPPPTDHAWRVMATGTATGLTVPFAHNTTFTDVGF